MASWSIWGLVWLGVLIGTGFGFRAWLYVLVGAGVGVLFGVGVNGL